MFLDTNPCLILYGTLVSKTPESLTQLSTGLLQMTVEQGTGNEASREWVWSYLDGEMWTDPGNEASLE